MILAEPIEFLSICEGMGISLLNLWPAVRITIRTFNVQLRIPRLMAISRPRIRLWDARVKSMS